MDGMHSVFFPRNGLAYGIGMGNAELARSASTWRSRVRPPAGPPLDVPAQAKGVAKDSRSNGDEKVNKVEVLTDAVERFEVPSCPG